MCVGLPTIFSFVHDLNLKKLQNNVEFTLSPLLRVALAILDLSWFEAFCITSNHLKVEKESRSCSVPLVPCLFLCIYLDTYPFIHTNLNACSWVLSMCSYNSPRSVLLLFSLHHVTETSISERLCEVSVRRHEAVVVEAWSQAGRAKTQSLALRTAGSTQDALILGGQVGTKQGLQKLKKEKSPVTREKQAIVCPYFL